MRRISLVVSELTPRPLEVLLNADPLAFTPAVQCRNLPNLYPCLAMERSPPAMSPVPEPRCRPVGHVSLPAGMQTLLVQRLQAHLQRSHRYPLTPEQAIAGVLDSRHVPVVSVLFVAADCERVGGAWPYELSLVLVAAQYGCLLRNRSPVGGHRGSG